MWSSYGTLVASRGCNTRLRITAVALTQLMMVWRVELDAREDIEMLYAINAIRSFVRRDEGQDLLEYALLVALIALGAVAAITLAGDNVQAIFEDIAAALGV